MAKILLLKNSKRVSTQKTTTKPDDTLLGKIVFFVCDGVKVGGKVKAVTGDTAEVALGLPMDDGILYITTRMKSVSIADLEVTDVKSHECIVREWETSRPLDTVDGKAVVVKDDSGVVVDYQNVIISGYGSTFEHITKGDRDGDYVNSEAFNESVATFRRNPVMLIDHTMSVNYLAGSFNVVRVDSNGLYLEGTISNAPELRRVRFLVKEKHLRTLSMGGFFFYGQDGREILKVILFEVSLVVVPANPDAEFTTRSITEESITKAFANFAGKSFKKN